MDHQFAGLWFFQLGVDIGFGYAPSPAEYASESNQVLEVSFAASYLQRVWTGASWKYVFPERIFHSKSLPLFS